MMRRSRFSHQEFLEAHINIKPVSVLSHTIHSYRVFGIIVWSTRLKRSVYFGQLDLHRLSCEKNRCGHSLTVPRSDVLVASLCPAAPHLQYTVGTLISSQVKGLIRVVTREDHALPSKSDFVFVHVTTPLLYPFLCNVHSPLPYAIFVTNVGWTADITMTTPIPQPSGIPLLGNIFDVDPSNTWNSLQKLWEKYGQCIRALSPRPIY